MKVKRSIDRMGNVKFRKLIAASVVMLGAFGALAAHGQSLPSISTAGGSGRLLPRNFIVELRLVNQFFPEIIRKSSSGQNSTAVAHPEATRSVIYANRDGSKLVTITVDRYRSTSDATAAYQEALHKSKAVPGFGPISIRSNVGQQSFVGTVTMGDETHVGLGALQDKLIVGATLAGFDAILDNIVNLVALARAEDAAAVAASGR